MKKFMKRFADILDVILFAIMAICFGGAGVNCWMDGPIGYKALAVVFWFGTFLAICVAAKDIADTMCRWAYKHR